MVDIRVSPTEPRPTHHIKLTDGSNEIGLILCDINGDANEFAIRREPYPRSALKTYSGQGAYDDEEPPFNTIAQENFSGGRGKLVFDEDQQRYYDGYRIDTIAADRVILGPQEHYCSGYRSLEQDTPGSIVWRYLYGSYRYRAASFTVSTGFNAEYIEVWIRKVGTPGTLTLALYDDNGSGNPNSALQTAQITASNVDDVLSVLYQFDISTQALSGSTTYHVVAYGAATDDSSDHWEIACNNGVLETIDYSSDGSSWSSVLGNMPHYRVLDAGSAMAGMFFEYKRGLYFIAQEDDATDSALYINGDRGVADSNTGALTTLIDASKSWTTNEWAGCVVLITAGPGAEENQPWRIISSNTATALTVSATWNVEHTTDTEYVILGSDKWTSVQDIGGFCTDVAVADDFVYFARGDTGTDKVLRYQWYNNSGAASTRTEEEADAARYVTAYRDASSGNIFIYGANNKRGSPWFRTVTVWRGQVPKAWGSLHYDLGEIVKTDEPWDEQDITNVTEGSQDNMTRVIIDVTGGFVSGLAAVDDIDATDITAGKGLGVMIKSNVATGTGNVKFTWSNAAATTGGGMGGTPASVDIPALDANKWHWIDPAISPTQHPDPDETAVISFGLAVYSNNGDQTIYMHGGIRLLADRIEYFDFPTEAPINKLLKYAGGVSDDVRENPWILTENQAYEFQTQANDAIVPLALGEISSLRSEDNGVGACVNGVYLWFNLGEKIERYYNRQLDDIGPDLDEGLPSERRGVPRNLLSYPGRVFAAVDGGEDNYSSILAYENSGWHETYRGPRTGDRIRGVYAQSLPGLVDRIWMVQGSDIIYMPIALNPEQEDDYTYTHEGVLITGRYYGGRRDISKYWNSLKLATENLNAPPTADCRIEVDYQTDAISTWTEISDYYDVSPFEEIDLTSDNSLSGKWLQLRLRFYTDTNTITPVLISAIIESLMRVPVKYAYQLTFRVADKEPMLDQIGYDDTGADEKIAQLDSWVSNIVPITMNSISSLEDSKSVYIEPASVRKVQKVIKEGTEWYVCQVTLIGI